MGIVHHSNYLRYCEEARVDWCRKRGLIGIDDKKVFSLTVLETRVKHIRPARYADMIRITMQAKVSGARLYFQYKLCVSDQLICAVETVHCNLDLNLKARRLDPELIKITEKEPWTETWL